MLPSGLGYYRYIWQIWIQYVRTPVTLATHTDWLGPDELIGPVQHVEQGPVGGVRRGRVCAWHLRVLLEDFGGAHSYADCCSHDVNFNPCVPMQVRGAPSHAVLQQCIVLACLLHFSSS